MRPSMSGESDFRPASTRRDITSNICCEMNVDDMFLLSSAIERTEVFQLNVANITVLTGTDKLVPSIDSSFFDIMLC